MRIPHYNRALILFISTLLAVSAIIFPTSVLHANELSIAENRVLDSAENFFIHLKGRKFQSVWELLTEESRKTIVGDVYNSSIKLLPNLQVEDVKRDFENNGVFFNNYWNAFLNNFNPDMILEYSLWEMGVVEEDSAEIIINYSKSSKPAFLRLFNEEGLWKIGLTETFWTRKKFDFLQNILDHIS